ncbi:MAG: hypothetical protein AAF567_21280 [Actinomycetota bacterium]
MTRRPSIKASLRAPLRAIAVVAALVLFAVACSSAGLPESYADQTDLNQDGQSTIERNWMAGCTPSLTDDLAAEAQSICQCSIDRIGGLGGDGAEPEIPFASFIEFNDKLSGDPNRLPNMLEGGDSPDPVAQAVVEIVRDCIQDFVPDAAAGTASSDDS